VSGFEHGARYVVNADGLPIKQTTRTNRGWCVEGIVLKYFHVFEHEGDLISVAPGAFDISIRDKPVEFWIEHDAKLRLVGCKLELHSTDDELMFRCHLDDSEIAGHVRDLVASGLYTEMSAGWHSSKTVTKNIDGKNVKFIVQGVLEEISLVPAGRVKTTHAQISELKNCDTLEKDCLRFRSDNDFVALRRAFQKLETEE
jgi:HK97 family phage prohead protease